MVAEEILSDDDIELVLNGDYDMLIKVDVDSFSKYKTF